MAARHFFLILSGVGLAPPLGELAWRSHDGEGESLPILPYRSRFALSVFGPMPKSTSPRGRGKGDHEDSSLFLSGKNSFIN